MGEPQASGRAAVPGGVPVRRLSTSRFTSRAAGPADISPQRLQELGRWALYVAHDVKTMVTVARTGLAAIQQGAVEGRGAAPQALRALEAALTRASSVLDEVLYFGTRRPLRRRRVCVVDVVGRVAGLTRTVAELSLQGCVVTERYDAAPLVWADEALLEASLTNLAFNAFQALQALGGRAGRLDFEVGVRAGAAAISIHNSSSPASPVPLEERLKGRGGREDGHGLGLIIARAGIEAHGGRIVFETTDQEAVRATVLLPGAFMPDRGR